MCVDYTDLNRACPKDSYPLPSIDQLVDSTSGFRLMSFMDAFLGYNQIRMAPQDEEKTAFITDRGTYCYKVMPFGLKNPGATYQRMVNKVFAEQLGRNMEAYVDDMMVKSMDMAGHINDLRETFATLRRHNMRLNPSKCAFGVTTGKFLGFIVSQRGIEANPEKIQAILDLSPPRTTAEVQHLTGCLTALSRFISKSAERCLPFFKTLRRAQKFHWNEECRDSFRQLKEYLASPPLLTSPQPGDTLFVYLAVSATAVSSVLVREEGTVQRPVYYTSRLVKDPETRYPRVEKTILALLTSARRLRPYFQAHAITVLTDLPLRQILSKHELSGRLVKWSVELSEFDIQYRPRPAIKFQILADFIAECTLPEEDPEVSLDPPAEEPAEEQSSHMPSWILHIDGSSTTSASDAGIVFTSPEDVTLQYALQFSFRATNNEAEYEALITGLKLAKELEIPALQSFLAFLPLG